MTALVAQGEGDENEGVHGVCSNCGNKIFDHMKENIEIFDLTDLCGVCATGEADAYFDEL